MATITVGAGREYATIQEAINNATDGDTIVVGPGIFNENIKITKSVTIQASGNAANTIILGTDGPGSGTVEIAAGVSGVTLKGLTIIGYDSANHASEEAALFFMGNNSDIRILDNVIVANGESAINSIYGLPVSDTLIDGNVITGVTFDSSVPFGDHGGGVSSFQWTENSPRPAVYFGGDGKTGITFSNNTVSVVTAGRDVNGDLRSNVMVNIDGDGNTAHNNVFDGTNNGPDNQDGAAALRMRGANHEITDNTFGPNVGNVVTNHPSSTPSGNVWLVDQSGTGGYSTIQAAINAASAGDTIVVAEGTYTESLSLTKGLTIVSAEGADVTIVAPGPSSAASNAITISGNLGGQNVTISGLSIVAKEGNDANGVGVKVLKDANIGTFKLENVNISDAGAHAVFVHDDDSSPVKTVQSVIIDGGIYSHNGYNEVNGASHIKLFGIGSADVSIKNVTLNGAADGVVATSPEYGIEITGDLASKLTPTTPAMGAIIIDGVKITGQYVKNGFAVFNFADSSGLKIDGLDLGGYSSINPAPWAAVNIDGIAGDIDASNFFITLPSGQRIELQGEKANQSAVNSVITGTDNVDIILGRDGNDTLDGGKGNDTLNGGAGSDTAVYSGSISDYTVTGGSGIHTITHNISGETDTLIDIEQLMVGESLYILDNIASPVITTTAFTVQENRTAIGVVVSTDTDIIGGPATYSIVGGSDAARFAIDPTTGALSFKAPQDFEAGKTTFKVEVSAFDGVNTGTQTITVTLTDVNDTAPVITSASSFTVPENQTAVGTVTATDADTVGSRVFSIAGGADAALFTINAATGALSFKSAPDYEAGKTAFKVTVAVFDGVATTTQALNVTLTDVNEGIGGLAPRLISLVAGVTEGLLGLTAVEDPDGDTLTYKVTVLPTSGTLFLDGVAVLANQVLSEAQFKALTFSSPDVQGAVAIQFAISDGVNTTPLTVNIAVLPAADGNIKGTPGNDRLDGAAGNDFIDALAGDDVVYGGAGNDTIYGRGGKDTLMGGDGDDFIHGGNQDDMLDGGDGNDTLLGGKGDDVVLGGAGDDVLKGNGGKDRLEGGSGDDKLVGGWGADVLLGGEGDDVLIGQQGKDVLTGGEGTDTFVFGGLKHSAPGKKTMDVITDFDGDIIDLSRIDARKGPGNQAFEFIGASAFSGKKGELRYVQKNGDTFVYGDIDGDRKADIGIQLKGKIDLTADDFLL